MPRGFGFAIGALVLSCLAGPVSAQSSNPYMTGGGGYYPYFMPAYYTSYSAPMAGGYPIIPVAAQAPPGLPVAAPAPAAPPALPAPPAPPVSASLSIDSPTGSRGGFYTGGSVMLYVPHFQNNLGIAAASTTTTGGSNGSNSLNQFYSYDLSVSPRLWLGYQGDSGLGVRTRWWHFEQASQVQNVSFPAPGGGTAGTVTIGLLAATQFEGDPIHAVAQDHLHLDVWDFEATDELAAGRWSLLFAGGIRYAHLSQGQNANLTGDDFTVGVSPTTQVGFVGHNFSGVGPTLALDARRPLGDSGFALFGSIRGAVLFGRDRVNEFGSSTDLMTNVTTNSSSLNSELGVVPVLEYEIGIEWARTVGRYRFFFRPAFAGEVWFGGATDGMVGLPTPTPTSKGPAANLGFIGMSLNTGFTF